MYYFCETISKYMHSPLSVEALRRHLFGYRLWRYYLSEPSRIQPVTTVTSVYSQPLGYISQANARHLPLSPFSKLLTMCTTPRDIPLRVRSATVIQQASGLSEPSKRTILHIQ